MLYFSSFSVCQKKLGISVLLTFWLFHYQKNGECEKHTCWFSVALMKPFSLCDVSFFIAFLSRCFSCTHPRSGNCFSCSWQSCVNVNCKITLDCSMLDLLKEKGSAGWSFTCWWCHSGLQMKAFYQRTWLYSKHIKCKILNMKPWYNK